jgi:RNA polymerase sigma-70 factor (ECF subfamily)
MTAEELVADIFFGMWIKRKELLIHTSVRAYLFATARNTALNHLRGEKKGKVVSLHEHSLEPVWVEGVEAGLEYYELLEQVEGIIERMPRKRQQIFRMHKLEGLKYHEIADRLSISVNTVQNQMTEAKKFMSQFHLFF